MAPNRDLIAHPLLYLTSLWIGHARLECCSNSYKPDHAMRMKASSTAKQMICGKSSIWRQLWTCFCDRIWIVDGFSFVFVTKYQPFHSTLHRYWSRLSMISSCVLISYVSYACDLDIYTVFRSGVQSFSNWRCQCIYCYRTIRLSPYCDRSQLLGLKLKGQRHILGCRSSLYIERISRTWFVSVEAVRYNRRECCNVERDSFFNAAPLQNLNDPWEMIRAEPSKDFTCLILVLVHLHAYITKSSSPE